IGILQKQENMTDVEFLKYWLDEHGSIVSQMPNLRRYYQNHVINSDQLGINYKRGAHNVDGLSTLWFDGVSSLKQDNTQEFINMLSKYEKQFIGNMQLITVEQNEVIPITKGGTLLKRISLLKRHPDVDAEAFKKEWRETHVELLKSMPDVKGYTQNLVIDRSKNRIPATYEEVPIDGIVELWFRDTVRLKASFDSEEGRKTMEHARKFISEITTFIVEPHRIV